MSDRSCTACNDLVEYAPVFAVKGVTEEACDSLASNTGLNPDLDPQHDDCDDLHDINDCLVGNMDDEVEAYDVCDWKDFMHEFIPNTYETLKAIICNDCGQWERIKAICALLNNYIAPPVESYGIRPDDTYADHRLGTINKKNGTPLLEAQSNPYDPGTEEYEYWNSAQVAGITYVKMTTESCDDGKCEVLEWIYPRIYHFFVDASAAIGDVLWYCTKTDLQNLTGFSDYLWHQFDISSYTWSNIPIVNGSVAGKTAWLTITVNPGGMGDQYLGIVFAGTSYPNEAPGYDFRLSAQIGDEKLYRHTCDNSEQFQTE